MEEINFTKMHGIGNDYIYLDCFNGVPDDIPGLSKEMSDRHCGVGADGIILILPSSIADFKMRIFNADGSEAQMCGNGSRCVGKYVYDRGLTDKRIITLETLAGIKTLMLHIGSDGLVQSVTVDMGVPDFDSASIPVDVELLARWNDCHPKLTAVSMGNPHGVIVLPKITDADVLESGPEMENAPMWPQKANIEFVTIDSHNEITMRVWERGSGETMACGTGACAAAVVASSRGLVGRTVTVHLRGGDLMIDWRISDGHVMMTGPAVTVFEGRYSRRSSLSKR